MLGRWGTRNEHPGGGRGGCGCVPAYTDRPRGCGAAMGVAGCIWERRVGLGVREEAGRLGRVGSVSCGLCWGVAARREWPLWWPARGPCLGRVAARRGRVGRVDGVGHVGGTLRRGWGHAERAGRAGRGHGGAGYVQEGRACRTASGMHGAYRTGLGDVEPGRGACQKGGACPGGARKVMGRGLGAGRVVGVWDVLGGLGVRVGWVVGPSERGGAYPGRAEPVR